MDSYSRRGQYRGFIDEPSIEGGFTKAAGDILYSWSGNDNKKNRKARFRMFVLGALFIAIPFLGILIYKRLENFNLGEFIKAGDHTIFFLIGGAALAFALLLRIVADYFEIDISRPKTFIDIDHESGKVRRLEIRVAELNSLVNQLRSAPANAENVGEVTAPDTGQSGTNSFESYILSLIKSLDGHIELSDKKASKLLDTGTMYLRRGIYFYVASIFVWQAVAHIWGVDKQLIFGVVSCSLTFLVVEFLAAWFLRQYRSFIDSSTQFMRVKSVFDRYLLSYLTVKEFAGDQGQEAVEARAQVLKVLQEEIKWPDPIRSKPADMNHMVEMFESVSGMAERLRDVAGKKKDS